MHQEYKEDVTELIMSHPDRVKELLYDMYHKHPENAAKVVKRALMGNHLDAEMCAEALATITRYDGVKAPFWGIEATEQYLKEMHIDTDTERFNEYDVNFLAQYYAADFKSIASEFGDDAPKMFVKTAIDKLRDFDDPKAHESAYRIAKRRIHEMNGHNPY